MLRKHIFWLVSMLCLLGANVLKVMQFIHPPIPAFASDIAMSES